MNMTARFRCRAEKTTVDHVIQQLTVELKAEMIRPLDRSAVNTIELAPPADEDEVSS